MRPNRKSALREFRIASLDGTELAVVSNENVGCPAVIFVHGTCSSYHIWQSQLNDPALNENCHLIAFDLRGNGSSDKPDGLAFYAGSDVWAGDLFAIIQHFSLTSVFLVAWSYGGRVVNDYLQVYGERKVAGINFIAAGTLSTDLVKGPGYKVLKGLFDPDKNTRETAEDQFVVDLIDGVQNEKLAEQMLKDLSMTPLFVRLYMRNREMHYEDMLANLQCPVLLTHGNQDLYSLPLLAELLEKHIPHAQLSKYKSDGHIPFVTSASRFNKELIEFVFKL